MRLFAYDVESSNQRFCATKHLWNPPICVQALIGARKSFYTSGHYEKNTKIRRAFCRGFFAETRLEDKDSQHTEYKLWKIARPHLIDLDPAKGSEDLRKAVVFVVSTNQDVF